MLGKASSSVCNARWVHDVDSVSADGSPVALYLALPAGEAPTTVHQAVRPQSRILELGSGPGRLTRVLIALGHSVTAVDDSQEMLEHVTGAQTICADIFDLHLEERFDVVLGASHLINRPGSQTRLSLLSVCRRHLAAEGAVLLERYPPGWLATAQPSESRLGPATIRFEPGPPIGSTTSATMTYRLGDQTWQQPFTAEDPPELTLRSEAAEVGLAFDSYLDPDQTWLKLVAL